MISFLFTSEELFRVLKIMNQSKHHVHAAEVEGAEAFANVQIWGRKAHSQLEFSTSCLSPHSLTHKLGYW